MIDAAQDIQEILLTRDQIATRVEELAAEISRGYADRPPLLVSVLKGAVYFLTDLTRALRIPVVIDFMAITNYGSARGRSGVVRLIKDLDVEITGRHVLLVEDIIDTGLTAGYLLRLLQARTPASLEICTLLDRPYRRILNALHIAYRGFEIPDRFVVGYGLDYGEQYRHLPFIGVLKDEILRASPAGATNPTRREVPGGPDGPSPPHTER